jgi:hypothetical protein
VNAAKTNKTESLKFVRQQGAGRLGRGYVRNDDMWAG